MKRLVICFIVFFFATNSYAQKKYAIVLPENYSHTNSYPLFIALHGGHGNMTDMQSYWTSNTLTKDFIVVYMEASTIDRAPNRYGWRNLSVERQNIKGYFSELTKNYPVKLEEIYVGGFSLGAKTSIDLALGNSIPVAGFILLNLGGGLTENCTIESIQKAKNRGLKGVVITGELDYTYKGQTNNLIEMMDTVGIQYKFIENKNTGHTTPENFNKQLDKAIDYLRQ